MTSIVAETLSFVADIAAISCNDCDLHVVNNRVCSMTNTLPASKGWWQRTGTLLQRMCFLCTKVQEPVQKHAYYNGGECAYVLQKADCAQILNWLYGVFLESIVAAIRCIS